MAAYGGIMNLNMGGMPRYNYGGGVQYFNQGGAVAMAEGGDMDATINIEDFPAKDGQIDGPGTEVSDDIPAMLSDGEFVMTAKAVKGAGSFNINDNNGILTLTPNGDPSRDSGTRVMYKLMEHFGNSIMATPAELLQMTDEELKDYIPKTSLSTGVGSTRKSYDNTQSPEEFRAGRNTK
jgi:hypothetical protein